MRIPRFRIRTLMIAVAVVGLGAFLLKGIWGELSAAGPKPDMIGQGVTFAVPTWWLILPFAAIGALVAWRRWQSISPDPSPAEVSKSDS